MEKNLLVERLDEARSTEGQQPLFLQYMARNTRQAAVVLRWEFLPGEGMLKAQIDVNRTVDILADDIRNVVVISLDALAGALTASLNPVGGSRPALDPGCFKALVVART